MKLDTAAIWFAAVLLALAPVRAKADNHSGSKPADSTEAVAATQPTTRPFTLTTDDAGRLILAPLQPGKVTLGGGRFWNCDECGCTLDDFSPRNVYWSGRLSVRLDNDGTLQLAGWREHYPDWSVTSFALNQAPGEVTATYHVRTPVGMPDADVTFSDRHTATLLLRHPELLPMLDHILVGIGASAYDPGPFVRAQLAGDLAVSDETRARVGVLLGLCDAPEWRTRDSACEALRGMGCDGALALLAMDRHGWTAAQGQAAGVCLSQWPVLSTSRSASQSPPETPPARPRQE